MWTLAFGIMKIARRHTAMLRRARPQRRRSPRAGGGKTLVTFLSMERRNLRWLYRTPWREIPCRRKLLNTTGRHQNTSSMPPVTTRKPPNTTMPAITKRRHITLTPRGAYGGRDRHWRCVLERPRLRRLAWAGTETNLDRRPNNPRQHIETRQSLSARPVRPGGLGRVGQGRAKALGALWAQVVDRSSEEATASQRPRHRARQQARPHCLERPGSWANLRG